MQRSKKAPRTRARPNKAAARRDRIDANIATERLAAGAFIPVGDAMGDLIDAALANKTSEQPGWQAVKRKRLIETDSAKRKHYPICSGLLDYFPDACAAVSEVSYLGNMKHNPGEPMHHARGKSMDHADCIARHLSERGGFDGGIRHTAALAWRAMALLQEELEREFGFPLPRGAEE